MAEAARQFSMGTEGRIRERILNAVLPIPQLYQDLIAEGDEIDAAREIRHGKGRALKDEIDALTAQLHQAESEVKKSGVDYYSENAEFDSKGAQTITRRKTGYVEKLKSELAAKKSEYRTLMEVKSRRKWVSVVDDALGAATVRLIPMGGPITWTPRVGEQFAEGYSREFGELNGLRDRVKKTWNAPLTKAEAISSADVEIDEFASEPPNFGGHIRGSSIGHRGVLQIGNPEKRIGFVEARIASGTVVDPVRLLAWCMKDQLKRAAREQIEADYSDDGAISASDKAALIPVLEAELWQQRRIVEAAYRAGRAAGIRNLNRPKDTPVEILLDVIPFRKANRMARNNAAATQVTPGQEAFEPNFEDND